jgi:hypothetical protein
VRSLSHDDEGEVTIAGDDNPSQSGQRKHSGAEEIEGRQHAGPIRHKKWAQELNLARGMHALILILSHQLAALESTVIR